MGWRLAGADTLRIKGDISASPETTYRKVEIGFDGKGRDQLDDWLTPARIMHFLISEFWTPEEPNGEGCDRLRPSTLALS